MTRRRGPWAVALAALASLLAACAATTSSAEQVVTARPATTVARPAATGSLPATDPVETSTSVPAPEVPPTVPAPASTALAVEAAAQGSPAATLPTEDPNATFGTIAGGIPSTGVTIDIPKIGVTRTLLEGIGLEVLDQGLGHWPGTALPGQVGNMVIAGHRMSHGHVFRDLDLLVPGDQLVATTPDGVSHTYEVTGTQIVNPTDVWIVDPTDTATATLFACHPKGSTRQRIVVFLALVPPPAQP